MLLSNLPKGTDGNHEIITSNVIYNFNDLTVTIAVRIDNKLGGSIAPCFHLCYTFVNVTKVLQSVLF